jgi:serine/threonine-protein kinase
MATVHIGRLFASGGFARRVAIKRLHPHLAGDPEIAAGFAEEARLSSRVAHVNVANILDVVSTGAELLLVMDYVHGDSLARLLAMSRQSGRPAPIAIIVRVLADALHGLHAAHEATAEDGTPLRLVHRDVSPQNILVGTDGAARVVDFGIAKTIASAHSTGDGQVKGKMPYLAPEQLLRRAIDRRTDVYAAGVTLWEALAGKRLFIADDEPTLFSKILEAPVQEPSRVDPRVPRELDAVVMRALDRDPDRRFATAREMAVALEAMPTLALASAVAEWVTDVARDSLARRTAIIADMEREALDDAGDGRRHVHAPSATVVFRDTGSSDDALVLPRPAGPSEETTRVSHSTRLPPSRRTHRIAAATLGIVLASGIVGMVALGSSRRSAASRAQGSSGPVAAGPSSASAEPPVVLSGSSAVGGPVASAAPEVAPVAAAVAPSALAPRGPERSGAPPATATPSQRWCKVFDPDKRIFVMKAMRVARCP